jgi:hypothetical protein
MNKLQEHMEKMVALLLIAYTIGLLVGESLRDAMYAVPVPGDGGAPTNANSSHPRSGKRWKLYSGLFILVKQKIWLSQQALERLIITTLNLFIRLVRGDVRTYV